MDGRGSEREEVAGGLEGVLDYSRTASEEGESHGSRAVMMGSTLEEARRAEPPHYPIGRALRHLGAEGGDGEEVHGE
jgi:hypothetical protein